MAHIDSTGYAHVRITVTDIARSKKFYDEVFGWPAAIDASEKANDPGVTESADEFYGGVIYRTPQGTLFGLRPVGSDRFDSTRTGLDHISFAVADRAALESARQALSDAGIPHGEIITLGDAGIGILSFQDPDGINLELTAPLS